MQLSHYQILELPTPCLEENGGLFDEQVLMDAAESSRLFDTLCVRLREPAVMPTSVVDAIAMLSRAIQTTESNRVLKRRSDRSQLATECQHIQGVIDRVIFRCFGLSDEEGAYVETRLDQMF